MKKIVLISPFPPAQNPRLLKEYEALKMQGYAAKVLYAERDQWASATPLNEDFILIGGKRGSLLHLATRVLHKFTKRFLTYAYSYHRVSILLYWRALKEKADLYIGHDLTGLPITVKAARKNKAKAGFDAEDFHRYEISDDPNAYQYKAAKKLEDQYIPQLDHFTAASLLIADAYHQLYPQKKGIVINNVFSNQFIPKEINSFNGNELKLFWFSQTVGKDRGLEQVIEAMGKLANQQITLTLLGMISNDEKTYFEALADAKDLAKNQLQFIAPVEPNQIFEIANQYHVGLALELNTPYNRNICLTNKFFTYLTAGLAVVTSETKAQQKLMDENPGIGYSFAIGDVEKLASILSAYYSNPSLLNEQRNQAKLLAETKLNWEIERKIFLNSIEQTLYSAKS